jgi:uridine phosphorylase
VGRAPLSSARTWSRSARGGFVRVGTCAALAAEVPLGAIVVADPVLARDGASRALGAGREIAPDPGLTEALATAAGPASLRGPVMTADLLRMERGAGALALDLESATVLAVAQRHGLAAAVILAVREATDGTRLEGDGLDAVEEALGRIALSVL